MAEDLKTLSNNAEQSSEDEVVISRRIFIGSSLFVVTAPLLACVPNVSNDLLQVTKDGQFFGASDMTLLVDMAEIMLPKTDTPGATDAQVIPVLDAMMLTWAGSNTKLSFQFFLKQLAQLASGTFDSEYKSLSKVDRTTLISSIDKRAFENKETELSKAYRKLKEIIYHIYFTSEQANPNYMLVPGNYRGCVSQKELNAIHAQGRVS